MAPTVVKSFSSAGYHFLIINYVITPDLPYRKNQI